MQASPTDHAADHERRLHHVFGDIMPESTSDDLPGHDEAELDERDRWLRDNRPPHHDTPWC